MQELSSKGTGGVDLTSCQCVTNTGYVEGLAQPRFGLSIPISSHSAACRTSIYRSSGSSLKVSEGSLSKPKEAKLFTGRWVRGTREIESGC